MNHNTDVLLTGASGFLGQAMMRRLESAGLKHQGVSRSDIGDIHRGTDWHDVLNTPPKAVIHLANRAHVMDDKRDLTTRLEAFREVNLHGTVALAEQARNAGVSRFVFVSSMKVLGESGVGLKPDAPPVPEDPYAISKAEAEAALIDIAGPMELVILRPPLIHGPGVRANFLALMKAVDRGIPLPLGAIRNKRSLIHVENMADALHAALTLPPGVYHPRDRETLSTADLIRAIATSLDKPARLIPAPVWCLKALGHLTGKRPTIDRLTDDFTSDGSMGEWTPPLSLEAGMAKTAAWFKSRG